MADSGAGVDRIDSLLCVERDGKFGGYRVDLLKEELPSYMKSLVTCNRCKGIMRDASGVGSPQVFMCSVCAEGSSYSALGPNREAVGSLIIWCPLKSRGCEWEGHISSSEIHLDTCVYLYIECNLLCGAVAKRIDMQSHVNGECLLRKIMCEHCTQSHKQTDKDLHLGECVMFPIHCTNGCGNILPRGDMQSHKEEVCLHSLLECGYRKYGCGVELMRKELDTHITEHRLQHIEMVMQTGIRSLSEELERVKDDNISIRKEFNSSKEELSTLQQTMDSVIEETKWLKRGLKDMTIQTACFKPEKMGKDCEDNKLTVVSEKSEETHFPTYVPGKLEFSVDKLSQLTNEKRTVLVYVYNGDKDAPAHAKFTKLTVFSKIVGLISKLQLSCLLTFSSSRPCQLDTSTMVLNQTHQKPYLIYRNSCGILPSSENRLIGHFNVAGEEYKHSCVLGEIPLDLIMEPGICVEDSIAIQLYYELIDL